MGEPWSRYGAGMEQVAYGVERSIEQYPAKMVKYSQCGRKKSLPKTK